MDQEEKTIRPADAAAGTERTDLPLSETRDLIPTPARTNLPAILKLLSNDDFTNLHPNVDEEDGTIGNTRTHH